MGDELVYVEGMRWLRDYKFYYEHLHMFNPRVGDWWRHAESYYGYSAHTLSANRLYAMPCPIVRRMRFDTVAVYVHVASATDGAKARLGIYRDNGGNYPGELVADFGEVPVDSTGAKTIAIDLTLDRGMYWTAVITSVADVQLRTQAGMLTPPIPQADIPYACYMYWYDTTYGPLPNPFPTGAGVINWGAFKVFLKVAEVLE